MTTYQNCAGFIALGAIFPVLAAIFGALRWKSRVNGKAGYGLDDALIVPATFLVIATGIAAIVGAVRGILGASSSSLESQQETQMEWAMQKWELTIISLHTWTTSLIRLSILFFYRRIFRGRFRLTHFDVINWTFIGITLLNLLGFFIATLVINIPDVDSERIPAITGMSLTGFTLSAAGLQCKASVINFVLDVQIALVPMCRVTRLQMSWTRKLQTISVFAVGLFAVAAACTRMVILLSLAEFAVSYPSLVAASKSNIFNLNGADTLGMISTYLFWSYIEMSVGCVVASLPAVWRLWDRSAIQNFLARYKLASPTDSVIKANQPPDYANSPAAGQLSSDNSSYSKLQSGGSGSKLQSKGSSCPLRSEVSRIYGDKDAYLEKVAPQGSYKTTIERAPSESDEEGTPRVSEAINVRTVIEVTQVCGYEDQRRGPYTASSP